MITLLAASEAVKAFEWNPPKITKSLYTQELAMLDSERDDYSTSLAIYTANHLAAEKASAPSLEEASRYLSLALQLSPRNKRAVVLNFQLTKGVLPEITEGKYTPQVLARLILSRGQLLAKQGGGENIHLARYFIQISAEIDPKNEDAVYASEVQRLDHGELNWASILLSSNSKP